MRTPGAAQILRIWEDGRGGTTTQQSMVLLSSAYPEWSIAELLNVSVGSRDELLLHMRQATLGSAAAGQAICPHCRLKVEFDFDPAALRVASNPDECRPFRWAQDGYELECRPIAVRDLLLVRSARDVKSAREELIRLAVMSARKDGASVDPLDLPDEVLEAVGEAIRERDPQSEIRVGLKCPECGHEWFVTFEVSSFLFREISNRAERTLREVHILARKYGWSESEILGMSPGRRRTYLELAQR